MFKKYFIKMRIFIIVYTSCSTSEAHVIFLMKIKLYDCLNSIMKSRYETIKILN